MAEIDGQRKPAGQAEGTGDVVAVLVRQDDSREFVGIDIAPAAVPVTTANALANGVASRVGVSTTDLADLDGTYDLVVANILAPALIALSADLLRVLAPGGSLVISGILAEAHAHVLSALAPLRVVATDELDGWVAVTLR